MWDDVVQLTNACTVEREDSRDAAAPKDLVDFRVAIRMITGRSTGGARSYVRLGYRECARAKVSQLETVCTLKCINT